MKIYVKCRLFLSQNIASDSGEYRLSFKFIDKVENAGPGFINIFFKKDYLLKELFYLNKSKDKFGSSNLGKNKKINVEFISANPTGPLHIAHSRGAVFGDVLSNIFEKLVIK